MAPRLNRNANVVSTTPYDGIKEIRNESFLSKLRYSFNTQEFTANGLMWYNSKIAAPLLRLWLIFNTYLLGTQLYHYPQMDNTSEMRYDLEGLHVVHN